MIRYLVLLCVGLLFGMLGSQTGVKLGVSPLILGLVLAFIGLVLVRLEIVLTHIESRFISKKQD
jgi:hypothetical protein